MKFLEKDLEEIIFTTPTEKLYYRGFYSIPLKFKRQVCIGNYGRADLIGLDYHHEYIDGVLCRVPVISVIELKQDKISVSSFLQAINYMRGVQHYLLKKKPKMYLKVKFNITLIGKTIDNSGSFVYIPEMFSGNKMSVSFYTYDYDFEGIKFSEHSMYELSKPGF